MSTTAMTVAGVMSGTSADGIDVAVVRIAGHTPGAKTKARRGWGTLALPKLTLVAHEGFAYSAALRNAVLAAMNARTTSTADLARLNWRLGIAYAEAVMETARRTQIGDRTCWMPRPDALSSAARGDVRGPQVCLHVAGGRGTGDRRGAASSCRLELPGRPTCSPADKVRRSFRCSTTCSSRMPNAGAFCRTSAASLI